MNNTNNALETLVQRDKQIKKANDKLKAELETTTNALSNHANDTNIHTSKEELIQLIVDHLESLDLGINKEVVSVLPTENISDNTLYFVPNDKGSRDEYFYINDKWELVGSTETNFTDYYTKLETNTLLEGKANSVHTHVTSDITDFPTIPTKTSQLINDSGFLTSSSGVITSVSWSDITNKPNFSTVATSGSYTDLSNTPTIPTKVSQLENDMGFGTGGDTSDCVHKTGDESIDGIKTFTSMLKIAHGTLQVGSDAGYSVTYDWKGSIVSKQPSGTYNISLPNANGTLAIDENLVHRTGDEAINGNKIFSNTIHRYADLTTSGSEQVYAFNDTNPNGCGHIFNNVHWGGDCIYNRHGAYNAKSGKTMEILIASNDDGFGMVSVEGTATKGNLETVTSETGHIAIATMGWVNNPATSTNVVHRSGDEYINGNKIFSGVIHRYADITTSGGEQVYRFVDTNANGCGYIYNNALCAGDAIYNVHGAYNAKSGKLMEIAIFSNDSGDGLAFVAGTTTKGNLETVTSATDHTGIATMGWVNNPATSTNVVHRSGDETIAGNKTFSNKIKGNLQGNADTATKATSADSVAWANVTGKPNIPTTPNAYVTATWASGLNWYRKWSNGFIEQGGFTSGANAPANKVVASILPLAFSNTKYTLLVQVTCGPSSGTSWGSTLPTTRSKSTTRFEVYLDTPVINGGGYDWYACGY